MADWKKIQAEYISGGVSLRQLEKKYGVSLSAISRRSKRENWADLRQKVESKATTKLVNSVAKREAKRVDEFIEIADMLLERIKKGIEDGTLMQDSQSLRHIAATLKDLREIKGIKSEADYKEQMARIAKLEKDVSAEENKDIRVIIDTELEELAK